MKLQRCRLWSFCKIAWWTNSGSSSRVLECASSLYPPGKAQVDLLFKKKFKGTAVASLWGPLKTSRHRMDAYLKSALWTAVPHYLTHGFSYVGSPRAWALPEGCPLLRAELTVKVGRRTRLCFFSHHGDKKLSQIFAYDFTGEPREGRLDWREEHLQKHIWYQQPEEG